jgi:hypothetical protein
VGSTARRAASDERRATPRIDRAWSNAVSASAAGATIERDRPAAGDRPPSPFALLFAPDRAMGRQARVGRVRWLLLFAWICSLALGVALAWRVDARASTLRKLETSGELKTMSDRQIAEATRSAERIAAVKSVATGALGAPLDLGLGAVALVGLGWFLRGRTKASSLLPCAAATLLPGAVADLVDAATAWRYAAIAPEGVELGPRSLSALLGALGHPIAAPWSKLGHALDFYSLWSAVLLAYGVVAVAQVPRTRAVVGTLGAWMCYRLLTEVAAGG